MLNWIAACFVTEPVGDMVATAVSAEQHSMLLPTVVDLVIIKIEKIWRHSNNFSEKLKE